MMNPLRLFQEVREEMRYVTWTRLSETVVNSIFVVVFVVISALFLAFADFLSQLLIRLLLGDS